MTPKDTIYIDIDDEITAIIEKVRVSDSKIVALVLPKRTTTLKSIVNMRLLKRLADGEKKRVVLITSEASLLPLAGAVGVHVAKTLQSKPAIPPAPELGAANNSTADEALDADAEQTPDPSKSIGELSGMPEPDGDDSIDVDNSSDDAKSAGKPKKDKKLKIPNFEKFRKLLLLAGGALVLLIFGLIFASKSLNKATVTIKTDVTTANSDVTLTASGDATEVNTAKKVVPSTLVKSDQNDTASAPATGQKDKGKKATGTVTLTLTDCSQDQVTVYAGTAVSEGGLTYITQSAVTLNKVEVGPDCNPNDPPGSPGLYSSSYRKSANVVAQAGGDKYNVASGKTFTVAGASNVSGSNSAAISGGTSDIVKVVAQADIDAAKKALVDKLTDQAKDDLNKQLSDQKMLKLDDSLANSTGAVKISAKLGAEASEVSATGVVTFSMIGIKQDDADKVIKSEATKQIDAAKQSIASTGLDNATFKITGKKGSPNATIEVQSTVSTGAELSEQDVQGIVAGKKKGEARDALKTRPGVQGVDIGLSPFWATKIPKDPGKVKVIFEQANSNGSANP